MLGRLAAWLVRGYQVSVRSWIPSSCRFTPTCSEYAIEAFRTNGLLRGGFQAFWRVMRCGPWTQGGVDEVRVRARG